MKLNLRKLKQVNYLLFVQFQPPAFTTPAFALGWSSVSAHGISTIASVLPCDQNVAMLKTCNWKSLIGDNLGLDK